MSTEQPKHAAIEAAKQFQASRELAIAQQAVMLVEFLEEHIKDEDPAAIKGLHVLAIRSAVALKRIAESRPELLKPIAGRVNLWPVMLGCYPAQFKRHLDLFEKIELGKKSIHMFHAKSLFKTVTPARMWAVESAMIVAEVREKHKERLEQPCEYIGISIFNRIISLNYDVEFAKQCIAVPDLTARSVEQWVPLCKRCILFLTNGKPSDVPELATMGGHRKNHTEGGGTKTIESNINDGIFKQIEKALRKVCKP